MVGRLDVWRSAGAAVPWGASGLDHLVPALVRLVGLFVEEPDPRPGSGKLGCYGESPPLQTGARAGSMVGAVDHDLGR
jgi:hypothetical protein